MATPRFTIPHLSQPTYGGRPLLYWHYDLDAVVAACVCALLVGMMLALPFKVEESAEGLEFRNPLLRQNPSLESRQELASQYQELDTKFKDLQKELAQERTLKQDLEADFAVEKQVSTQVITELQRARLLAGIVPAEGPGIVLKLSENLEGAVDSEDVGLRMIHQEDLLNIVNELWASGAEAMAVRSSAGTERLVASSSIRCVGPTVIVNSQRMGPPFEIMAIGDPETLRQGLEIPNGVLAVLGIYNINHEIVTRKQLILPAYSGKSFPEFASVHEENVEEAGDAAKGSGE